MRTNLLVINVTFLLTFGSFLTFLGGARFDASAGFGPERSDLVGGGLCDGLGFEGERDFRRMPDGLEEVDFDLLS